MGDFDRARRHYEAPLMCPHCGAADLEPPASPTLERQAHGMWFCTSCSKTFTRTQEKQ